MGGLACGIHHKFLKGVHIRSEVKLDTFVNSALYCYTKEL
jgi:hypothetical protein